MCRLGSSCNVLDYASSPALVWDSFYSFTGQNPTRSDDADVQFGSHVLCSLSFNRHSYGPTVNLFIATSSINLPAFTSSGGKVVCPSSDSPSSGSIKNTVRPQNSNGLLVSLVVCFDGTKIGQNIPWLELSRINSSGGADKRRRNWLMPIGIRLGSPSIPSFIATSGNSSGIEGSYIQGLLPWREDPNEHQHSARPEAGHQTSQERVPCHLRREGSSRNIECVRWDDLALEGPLNLPDDLMMDLLDLWVTHSTDDALTLYPVPVTSTASSRVFTTMSILDAVQAVQSGVGPYC